MPREMQGKRLLLSRLQNAAEEASAQKAAWGAVAKQAVEVAAMTAAGGAVAREVAGEVAAAEQAVEAAGKTTRGGCCHQAGCRGFC